MLITGVGQLRTLAALNPACPGDNIDAIDAATTDDDDDDDDDDETDDETDDDDDNVSGNLDNALLSTTDSPDLSDGENQWETIETTIEYDNRRRKTILPTNVPPNEVTKTDESCTERCWECIENMFLKICSPKKSSFDTAEKYKNMSKLFLKADHVASRIFPLTFLIINVAYWVSYLYIL